METPSSRKPKVAIVHDFLTYFGGAEQVLISLHHLYPQAPIYTLLYDPSMGKYFPDAKVRPSFLNRFPQFLKRRKKFLLPLFPTAAETFDLSEFDLVISSSSSFAKAVIVRPKTTHISYCHAPTRFLWDWYHNYLEENRIGAIKKLAVVPVLHLMRLWDRSAAERVDHFVANSQNTARKIAKFYRAESTVIHPPVDFKQFQEPQPPVQEKGYYLIVSRLSAYKKIDVAIAAFNKLQLPLIIVGTGEDEKRLRRLAGDTIVFKGFLDQEQLTAYYQNARAVIFPGEDDFGITILEAMCCGKPVLAYGRGGALETVTPGESGELFESPVPELLADGIRRLNRNYDRYDPGKIKARAREFSRENFEKRLQDHITQACSAAQE